MGLNFGIRSWSGRNRQSYSCAGEWPECHLPLAGRWGKGYAVGWDERALFDAVQVCCLYNFMNRFIEGLGLSIVPEQFDMEGQMIKDGGYDGMLDAFGIK